MPIPPPFLVPPVWSNGAIRLYHGTLTMHQAAISAGVNPSLGSPRTDFGIGFYTTTSLVQAKSWAWQLAAASSIGGVGPVGACVMAFEADRNALARLETLAFARGDREADDFWSFVFHCRNGGLTHGRAKSPGSFYDVVYGPVTAFWSQRVVMLDSDQISFHTPAAAACLTPLPKETVFL